jgi:tetratricopeptide (TPR) repeat protein
MPTPSKILALIGLACAAGCATSNLPRTGNSRVDVDSHVLLAELARERGQFAESTEHYLDAAVISDDPQLAALTTEMAHRVGLDDVGLMAARRWYELDPENFRSAQFLGLFLMRTGNLDESVAVHEALLATARNQSAGLSLIVEALMDDDDRRGTMALVSRLVDNHPDIAEGHFGLARMAMRADDYALAVTHARQAAELRPDWPDAQLLLARLLVLTGRAEEGLALIEPLADESDDLEIRLQFAELLLSSGRSGQARTRLDAILAENPGLPEAIRALAFLTLTQNELDESKGYFEQLRAQPRFREEAFFYLGRIAEAEEQPLQAMRAYSRVTTGNNAVEAQLRAANMLYVELDDHEGALQHLREFGLANPDYEIEMLIGQSDLLVRMNRHDEAMQLISDGLERHPDERVLEQARLQLYLVHAQAAVADGDLRLAERLLRDALRDYPGNVSLRYAQALLYQEQGHLRRAADALESLVSDTPEDAGLLNALGYLLTDSLDRHQEAFDYIQQALTLEPDNAAIIDSMGWVLFHLGDHEAALDYLQRAFELFPDPEVAAHIIDVYLALGDRREAEAVLSRELAQHPDDPHLKDVQQRHGL